MKKGNKAKTTPHTDGKSDRADDIQEERDENRGDDAEEDEVDSEEFRRYIRRRVV